MGNKKMDRILRVLMIIMLLCVNIAVASSPSLLLLTNTTTDALSTSAKDTVTVTGIDLGGDSVGVMINFNRDSVSGYVLYQYVTPQGNSNTTMANSDTLFSFDCNEGEQAAFGGPIPVTSGNYQCYLYFIFQNDDATTQTITANIYKVTWR